MEKEYIITVKIGADTIGKGKYSKVLESADQLSDIMHEALARVGMPVRGAVETGVNQNLFEYSFKFVFVEGGNLIKVLSGIRENLRLRLKMKPEDIELSLTSIVDGKTGNSVF